MDYYSLDEAVEVLKKEGANVSSNEILRDAIACRLSLTVPLSCLSYSPTYKENRDICGLFIVPPRHLFEIDAHGSTTLKGVCSLDGKEFYFPHVPADRQMLRVSGDQLAGYLQRSEPAKVVEVQHTADDPGSAAIKTRFVLSVAEDMENSGKRVTLSAVWVRLAEMNGKNGSIIEDTKNDCYLCNVGEPELSELTHGSVRGILNRRKARLKHD